MRNSRSDSARATDENDALDLFPLEREDARRATGSTGDPVDVSYRDSVPFDEDLLYEASGDGMRRLAFLEWRRRVLKICFTALALAGVFVAVVVLQRSPFSLWFSQDDTPPLVSEAETATPVPPPPVDVEPPVADAVPPPTIDQPPAQATIDQSVDSSTRVENPPRTESNKRSGNDRRTAGNAQIQTNPATQGGSRGQNRSRIPNEPPLAAWKVGVPATSPSAPAAQTPASAPPVASPPPVAQTPDKPDTKRALVPPDSNKALVPPDVNRVRISPDVNKVVLPSQPGAAATPAAASTPEKTASNASAAPPTPAPLPPASPPPPRPAATPSAATAAPPTATSPPSVTTSSPATTNASPPVRPPAEAAATPPVMPVRPPAPAAPSNPPSPSAAAPRTSATAPAAPVVSSSRELDTRGINGALARYRSAFGALDATAAAKVWPTVDRRSLTRAFERLREQEVTFDDCQIELRDLRAQAFCSGIARYVPRVGSSSPQVDRRRWTFDLVKRGDEWLIGAVEAR
ncbi:MAG TPA: hypothetical protein VGF24_31815 [Vicinamibacterales bacterium]